MLIQKEKKASTGAINPVDTYVGQKLRFRRSMLGVSQEKLANLLGITFQQVQKYEKGVNRMGASRLYNIAKHLKVEVGYFFDGYENAKKSGSDGSYILQEGENKYKSSTTSESKETIQLLRAYYKIEDPDMRKKALEVLKAMGATSKK